MIEEPERLAPVQRLRLGFSKDGPARYISHLDLARTLERALNRARLPVAYTQGFNRRPRLSLAAALPLGYTSEAELADVWLVETIPPDSFLERLMDKMAPGVVIHSVEDIDLKAPSLQQQVVGSLYRVTFLDPVNTEDLEQLVTTFQNADTVMLERRRKGKKTQTFDLKERVLNLEIRRNDSGQQELWMHLYQTAEITGRPDDLLAALGFDPLDQHVHRRAIFLADSN